MPTNLLYNFLHSGAVKAAAAMNFINFSHHSVDTEGKAKINKKRLWMHLNWSEWTFLKFHISNFQMENFLLIQNNYSETYGSQNKCVTWNI